jgi:4'-phosphopantetheinyl transferase EntD
LEGSVLVSYNIDNNENNRSQFSDEDSGSVDPSVQRAIEAITFAVPVLLIGHRVISQGDEYLLLRGEMDSLSFRSVERLRASGAARHVARNLMKSMGYHGLPILGSTFGAPIWPIGVVGSMAHDDRIAVAAVGLRRDLDAVGIDIEPIVQLPPNMLKLVATPLERRAIADNLWGTNLLFAIKEAVYKASFPLDSKFLDFHDIEVDLAGRLATTRAGLTLGLHWCVFSHVLVMATVQKPSMNHLPSM